MFEDLKKHVKDWEDEDALEDYLEKLLDKQVFDKKGLIYGMGHAVYTISDPRQQILHGAVKKLAFAEGHNDEFDLYERVERLAPKVIGRKRKIYKGVAANVDFYSGLLTAFLIFRVSFILRFLQQLVLRVGAHTDLRSLSTAVRLSVLHI